MLKKITFIIFLSAFAMLAQANAQTAIAPEKQAVIKEILTLMDADDQIDQLVKVFSTEMDAAQREIIKSVLNERVDLTPAEKRQIEELILGKDAGKKKAYEERILAKVDYKTALNEIVADIYDKFYTLDELKELLVFYKSPVGQKLIKLMPAIASETLKGVQEKLVPKIIAAVNEIEAEDRAEIEKKVEARKPRPKKTGTK